MPFRQEACDSDPGRLDFTDYAPEPVLEDEYFGSFRPTYKDYSKKKRRDGRHCSEGEFSRSSRGPKGWVHEPWSYGLADGQTPELRSFLSKHGRWPKYPGPLGTIYRDKLAVWEQKQPRRFSNQIAFPFALQAIRQAEQKLPEVNPERDRAEELERQERRPADPPFTPQGILHAERAHFYAQHTERRIQKLKYRGFKPSKKLELKRMPTLKRVERSPLLTKEYLARTPAQTRDEHRALLALLRVDGSIPLEATAIAPEKTAAQLKPKKMGRPSIGDHAMTAAERKRRSRANSKTLPTQERPSPGIAVPPSLRPPAVPGFILDGDNMNALLLELAAIRQELRTLPEIRALLGQVLAKQGTDHALTQDEFRLITAAASLVGDMRH